MIHTQETIDKMKKVNDYLIKKRLKHSRSSVTISVEGEPRYGMSSGAYVIYDEAAKLSFLKHKKGEN